MQGQRVLDRVSPLRDLVSRSGGQTCESKSARKARWVGGGLSRDADEFAKCSWP